MNKVSNQKENPGGYDGSAARTRPTSVEEIMLRRKRKESLENLEEKTVGAAAHLLGNNFVEKASDCSESEKGYDISKKVSREERGKISSRKKENVISTSRDENLMKEEPGGETQLVANNFVEKVSDCHASEKGHHESKHARHEELVKENSRKKEDASSNIRGKNSMKEDPVRAAQLPGNDHVEKASEYHSSEKAHDRSKKVSHKELGRDISRKKEDAISSFREEKSVKEDLVGAAQSLGNNLVRKVSDYHASEIGSKRSEKLRHGEGVQDSSRKKEKANSSYTELKPMKEDFVGATQLLTKDRVEKVYDYHTSKKGHGRSKKVNLGECESSRKKEGAISDSREEVPMKENPVGTTQLLGKDLDEKVSDYHENKKGYDKSEIVRREKHVKDSSRKKEEAISSSREERPDKPKKEEELAADRKRKSDRERSTAETKLVEEHTNDRRRTKEETNSNYREERLNRRIKKEDLTANRKVRVEGESPSAEIKTMADRDGLVVDTKMKSKRQRGAARTTEKQIYPQDAGWEQTRSAIEFLPGSRKRLRSLVVADIPRDEDSLKPDNENKSNNQNGDHKKDIGRNMSERHDLGKVHNVEVSERSEKREHTKSLQRDKREKRKRSRSRDHVHDRQKRSSPLPRVEKATSRHKRDHKECSEKSVKDRSGKHHSNDNENKMSNTGSNKSRRYSASKSELGGYSPRKRREEAPAKAASPPNHSSEKKVAKWDLAPTITAGVFSGTIFSGLEAATQTASTISGASLTLLKPHMEVPFRMLPTRQTTSADSVQLTESTRRMRRLCVENVPDSASEKSLIDYFNGNMLSSGSNHIQGSQPCISCIINKEKQQAVVEFLTPEDTSAAVSLDGCSFEGTNLNIRRPKDYVGTTNGELEKKEPAVNVLSDNVEDSSNKIFIGGFPRAISYEMLMEIVCVFGPLKAYRYVVNNDLNQPCAFLEYTDGSVTHKACAGLNGMKLGGSVITAVCALPDASSVAVNENPPLYGIPENAKPLLGKPKHILKLKNVIDPEDLPSLSEAEVKEILEDVRLECGRFGVIKSINFVAHQSKDFTGSETNPLANLESTDCKELNVAVVQEKDAGSKKADDIADNSDPAEVVRPDSSTGEVQCSDTAVETNTEVNEDPHSTEQDSNEKIVGVSVQDEAELYNPQEEVGSVRTVKTRWDTEDKIEEEEKDPEDVFEPGCILIEFRRTEATREAAHSLHGRLYANRTVKAEYVSRELYQIRFPSG